MKKIENRSVCLYPDMVFNYVILIMYLFKYIKMSFDGMKRSYLGRYLFITSTAFTKN